MYTAPPPFLLPLLIPPPRFPLPPGGSMECLLGGGRHGDAPRQPRPAHSQHRPAGAMGSEPAGKRRVVFVCVGKTCEAKTRIRGGALREIGTAEWSETLSTVS